MACMKDGFVEGMCLDGRYVTVSPLNHGSFGMVFLAKDSTNDELVAIKCLSKTPPATPYPEASGSDHLIELLCHDRLGLHRNIVNLLHAFETEAHMFLVLEFCSMGDLYEAIRVGRGPLQTEHVRDFMVQLVDAIEYMHQRGLYHRDIKPENIFLSQDGTMKLGDFGLSTTENWTYEASVGSDRYMAPEQFDPSDTGYSPAHADIWSIGICLLNVLFSRNPFVTPSETDVLFADFVRDKQSLFDVFPSMSQDTFEVLMHALAIDPSKRSLAGIRDALKRVVSFTTDEDTLDDFCTEDREVVPATANRQPLRTPSIQSPPVEQGGAFPWAKALALQMSPPQAIRQLSAIPDTETDADSLFPEQGSAAWYRTSHEEETKLSSVASVLDSALGASVRSMNLQEPKPRNVSSPLSSSVPPPTAAKPIAGAISSVFGSSKKDTVVSKSWSDLWDEEEEEREEDARRAFNNRNWSSETLDEDLTIGRCATAHTDDTTRKNVLGEIKNSAAVNIRTRSPPAPLAGLALYSEESSASSGSSSNEEDASSFETSPKSPPLYSPPAKRSVFFDKWAALGNRRRAIASQPQTPARLTASEAEIDPNDATPKNNNRRNNTDDGGKGNGAFGRRGFRFKAFSGNSGRDTSKKDKDNNNKSGNGNGNGNGVYRYNHPAAVTSGSAIWDRKDAHQHLHAYQPPKSAGLIPSYGWRRDQHRFSRYHDGSNGPADGAGGHGKGFGGNNGKTSKYGGGPGTKGGLPGAFGFDKGFSSSTTGRLVGPGVTAIGKRDSLGIFTADDLDVFVEHSPDDPTAVVEHDFLHVSSDVDVGDPANDDLEWVGGWHDLHL